MGSLNRLPIFVYEVITRIGFDIAWPHRAIGNL